MDPGSSPGPRFFELLRVFRPRQGPQGRPAARDFSRNIAARPVPAWARNALRN